MQRRTIKRTPPGNTSPIVSSSPKRYPKDSDTIKGRSICSAKSLLFVVVFVFGIIACFIPTEELIRAEHKVQEELIRAEHQVEEKVEEWMHYQPQLPKEMEMEPEPPEEEEIPETPPKESAKARTDAHSTRWVDGEKALRKKLLVLFDMQKKGNSLGVPVLTRYLGEDFPAFVGTPDSTMNKEEFEKLVEAKYEEMRKEEEEWQTKMALLIEKNKNERRDMGITTP